MKIPLRLTGLCLAGTIALTTGCFDDQFVIPNTNSPTQEQLTETPNRTILAQTATGIFSQVNTSVGGQIQQFGLYGRELYNLLGNDPRETGEEIRGPQDPGGRAGGLFGGYYQAIRTINSYLAAIPKAADLSAAEQAASRGFAKTLQAWHFYRIAIRSGPLGFPIDVDRPINAEPAPFVSESEGFAFVASLLNEAATDLQAGGGSFPFTMAPGYTGFDTPASFLRFNRALLAKVEVTRATLLGCGGPCFTSALTALGSSFLTTSGLPGSLNDGVFYAYSSASGEPTNPISENLTAARYWIHPSIEAMVQLRADGSDDLRWTAKARKVAEPRVLNELSSDIKPIMYNDNTPTTSVANLGTDIPLIKNEELILLRAEARLGSGDKQGAIDDINLIRVNAGGLPPTTLTAASADADIITEIIYNRTLSLLFEQGSRWMDHRKYNRLNQLPLDRPGDVVHPFMLVPAGECDNRGLGTPCSPLGN